MKETKKIFAMAVALSIIAVISFVFLGNVLSNPETYGDTLASLNEKRDNVIAMTASSTAISAGISMIPGEFGTSIADQLANLSYTLLIVLCAIFLEKYLLVIAGTLLAKVIIPVCCVVFIVNMITKNKYLKNFVIKLLIFGICLVAIVPVTTFATNLIEDTYSISIEQNLEDAEKLNNDLENEDASLWDKATGSISNAKEKVKNTVGNFIENAAVLIITSCVFPILTFVFLLYITRSIFNLNTNLPKEKLSNFATMGSKARNKIRGINNKEQ